MFEYIHIIPVLSIDKSGRKREERHEKRMRNKLQQACFAFCNCCPKISSSPPRAPCSHAIVNGLNLSAAIERGCQLMQEWGHFQMPCTIAAAGVLPRYYVQVYKERPIYIYIYPYTYVLNFEYFQASSC